MNEMDDLLDKEVDVESLLRNLDFDEKELTKAARLQSKLMLKAARVYVQASRRRNEIEAKFDLLKSELASEIRESTKIKSEGHLKELLVQDKEYRRMKRKLDRAKQLEDIADSLKSAYMQRAGMIRVVSDVIGAEMATGVRLQERVRAMDEARRKIKEKYGR